MHTIMKYDPTIEIADDPDVYPPSDDSIMLIQSFDVEPHESVLEIGCGSGVVSIHCARNGAHVTCGDINPKAVEITRSNAERNGVVLTAIETNLFSNINDRFDTIIFNLPYLPVDDEGLLAKAWSGGTDGTEPLERLIKDAPDHLNPDGRLILVVSSLMNQEKMSDIFREHRVKHISELHLFFEKLEVLEVRLSTN